MPRVSDIIEKFIKSMMEGNKNDTLEIQRNELANYFNCSPSQINYVLATRFTTERGYYIESKRGGGGYIKIIKVNIKENNDIKKLLIDAIGNSITKQKAYTIIDNLSLKEFITDREARLMKSSIGDRPLNIVSEYKNEIRARILKDMILALVK